jgi:hypothetical protein
MRFGTYVPFLVSGKLAAEGAESGRNVTKVATSRITNLPDYE